MKPKTTIILVLIGLLLILILQNLEVVNIKFFFWHIQISQLIVALILLIVGFITGYALGNAGRKRER